MTERRRVLFVCTGNSCRSQMAEAILRHLAGERLVSLSAGSHPAGYVHPLAAHALRCLGVPLGDQRSKSWDEFAKTQVDLVITVCDAAAGEACPVWPGNPIRAYWPMPDPAGLQGSDEDRLELAIRVAQRLQAKIESMIAIDWSDSRQSLEARLRFLGQI